MATYKTKALIIRTRDFLEADKIVNLLTPNGRVDAVAKSARKPNSRKSSHIEILNYFDAYLARGKNLDILLEIKNSNNIKIQTTYINYIFYIAEILEKTIFEIDHKLYKRFIECLEIMDTNIHCSILKIQLIVLEELGSLPNIKVCIDSDEELKYNRYSNAQKIGYSKEKSNGRKMSERELKIQTFLINNNNREILGKINIDLLEFNKLFHLQNKWIEIASDVSFKSVKLL